MCELGKHKVPGSDAQDEKQHVQRHEQQRNEKASKPPRWLIAVLIALGAWLLVLTVLVGFIVFRLLLMQ